MSDEETPVEETVTADTSTETGTQDNWQQRYDDLQPAFTKASQEAAELRQWREQVRTDPDEQRKFLAELGFDVEDDTPTEEPTDLAGLREQLLAEVRAELEPVKQTQAQAAQERELAAAEAHAAKVFTDLGVGEKEQDAVIGMALTMPADENGMPPFAKAYEALEAIWTDRQAAASKGRKPTHQFTPSGVAGDDKPDRSTSQGRVEFMLNQLSDTA